MKKDIATLKEAVTLLKTVTGKLDEGQKLVEGTMQDLQNHKRLVEEKVGGMTNQVNQVMGSADNVKSKITNIEQTVNDLRRQAGF